MSSESATTSQIRQTEDNVYVEKKLPRGIVKEVLRWKYGLSPNDIQTEQKPDAYCKKIYEKYRKKYFQLDDYTTIDFESNEVFKLVEQIINKYKYTSKYINAHPMEYEDEYSISLEDDLNISLEDDRKLDRVSSTKYIYWTIRAYTYNEEKTTLHETVYGLSRIITGKDKESDNQVSGSIRKYIPIKLYDYFDRYGFEAIDYLQFDDPIKLINLIDL